MEGAGDSVHVHASMVGDVYKLVPWMEAAFKKGYQAVDAYRKRAKLLSDFFEYQEEQDVKPVTFIKARFERMGSKFFMSRRLLRMKKVLRQHVHKRRFKGKFGDTASEIVLRKAVAATLKDKAWWKSMRQTCKVLSPIIKSMRVFDSRIQGKAGLLWPSLASVQHSVKKRLETTCEKQGLPAQEVSRVVGDVTQKLAERAGELGSDRVKAACRAHPYNNLKARAEEDRNGPKQKLLKDP